MEAQRLGQFIAEQRKHHNMTQGQLAEKMHVSTSAVSKWERGLCLPELTKLEDLSETLDLTLIELMQCRKSETIEYNYDAEDVQEALHSTVHMSGNEIQKNKNTILFLKVCLCLVITIALFISYLLFSRPMTLSQLYPMIELNQCSRIHGYYGVGSQEQDTEFSYDKDDETFWRLLMLFNEQEYRRSLKDLLPGTTKTHRIERGDDFWWEVSLRFDEFTMPDGSISSGFLSFHNWYGDLEIYFNGESYFCFTKESKLYDSVFKIIQSEK